MVYQKWLINIAFILTISWAFDKDKEARVELQYEKFNQSVIVEVVDLPPCNRSAPIVVGYNGKRYTIYVNINDCIKGRYQIGDTLKATYNPKLDEINPILGAAYTRQLAVLVLILYISYLSYSFYESRTQRRRKPLVANPRINKPVQNKPKRIKKGK